MKNMWPKELQEEKVETPKSILEEQASLLPKLTGDMVHAEVEDRVTNLLTPKSFIEKKYGLRCEFKYDFSIVGNFLDYKFNVLSFTHDVTIYPVLVKLDREICEELKLLKEDSAVPLVLVKNAESFEEFLQDILGSERIKKVIGAILRLSRDYT